MTTTDTTTTADAIITTPAETPPELPLDSTMAALPRYWRKVTNADGSLNWINWGTNQRVGAGLVCPGNRKFVFTQLCRRANTAGQCWPSQARLAKDTEMSERQVRRELDGLERDGWITREKRTTAGGTFKADLITINVARGVMH